MKEELTHLVIGYGEVGKAIQNLFKCDWIDKEERQAKQLTYRIIHVCCNPFDCLDAIDEFGGTNPAGKWPPGTTVIVHSTLKLHDMQKLYLHFKDRCYGTSQFVHSPIRGKHPNLYESLFNFTKYFSGPNSHQAAKLFEEKGVKTYCTHKWENTEALKLWDTEIYREAILLEKRIHKYCEENGLDFNLVYTHANQTYNEGYRAMGMPQFQKYVIQHVEGPIGGHCLEPNHKLLGE